MKKIIIYLLIFFFLIVNLPTTLASEEGMDNLDYFITITTKENYLSINEEFTIQGDSNESYDSLSVWIQTGAYDIDLLVNSEIPDSKVENGLPMCVGSVGGKLSDQPL